MVDQGHEFKALLRLVFFIQQILSKHLFCQGLCLELRRQLYTNQEVE